jgi:hypothetical protein
MAPASTLGSNDHEYLEPERSVIGNDFVTNPRPLSANICWPPQPQSLRPIRSHTDAPLESQSSLVSYVGSPATTGSRNRATTVVRNQRSRLKGSTPPLIVSPTYQSLNRDPSDIPGSSRSGTTRSHRSRQSSHRYVARSPGAGGSSSHDVIRCATPPQSTQVMVDGTARSRSSFERHASRIVTGRFRGRFEPPVGSTCRGGTCTQSCGEPAQQSAPARRTAPSDRSKLQQ